MVLQTKLRYSHLAQRRISIRNNDVAVDNSLRRTFNGPDELNCIHNNSGQSV